MSSSCKLREVQFSCPLGPLTSPLHERFPKVRCGDISRERPSHLQIRSGNRIFYSMAEAKTIGVQGTTPEH